MTLNEKKLIDDAIANNKRICFAGGRGGGKKLMQQYILLKKWPTGVVAHVSANGIKYSELANVVEIKT